MINKERHPDGWAALMYELEDAQEHLARLISEIASDPEYGEVNLRVDLGHVYSHLNRAWHGRNAADALPEAEWRVASRFPTDLEPV
ncbi:hypothetical protein J2X06_002923 [Lysobacter niastensis]|uniref:Uncharacterized protein n=1 Tax=Lysobacter niastensis TaxID=380629 RepID=A0ABU1WE90_9GAMM|nr:hypothetical protein [Lysobacter niastensis]MDR7135714.1 hypothetical protein [Lysobacter niastensis]